MRRIVRSVRSRFQKLREPKIPQVKAQPGIGRIQLVQDGIVLADLVLAEATYSSREGVSATFMDYEYFSKGQIHDRD